MNIVIIDRMGNKKIWANITKYQPFGDIIRIYNKNKVIAEYIKNNLIGWYEVADEDVKREEVLMRWGKDIIK